jgi:hypothetical protein
MIPPREAAFPVIPLFPALPPPREDMARLDVSEQWTELLRHKASLIADWTAEGSSSLRPTTDYHDLDHLEEIAVERLETAMESVLRAARQGIAAAPPTSQPVAFIGDYPHPRVVLDGHGVAEAGRRPAAHGPRRQRRS